MAWPPLYSVEVGGAQLPSDKTKVSNKYTSLTLLSWWEFNSLTAFLNHENGKGERSRHNREFNLGLHDKPESLFCGRSDLCCNHIPGSPLAGYGTIYYTQFITHAVVSDRTLWDRNTSPNYGTLYLPLIYVYTSHRFW